MSPEIKTKVIKLAGGIGSSVVAASSLFWPAQPTAGYATTSLEIPRGNGKMYLTSGAENDPHTSINILQLLDQGVTLEMARQITEQLMLRADPINQYRNKFRTWVVIPAVNLRCNQVAECDFEAIKKEIRITEAAGVIPHLTQVIIRSHDEHYGSGKATLRNPFNQLSNDGYCSVVRPLALREIDKGVDDHECIGHLLLNLTDARPLKGLPINIGTGFYNCTRTPEFWRWIPTGDRGCDYDPEAYVLARDIMDRSSKLHFDRRSWGYIDQVVENFVFAIQKPRAKINLKGSNFTKLSDRDGEPIFQLREMGYTLLMDVPNGTTGIMLKISPAPNIFTGQPDGPVFHNIYGWNPDFKKTGLVIPAPLIGVGNYHKLPGMSETLEYWVTDAKESIGADSPKWRTVKNPYTMQDIDNPPTKMKLLLPNRDAKGISYVSPSMGEIVTTTTPLLVWHNVDQDVFYYHIQVSKDCSFNTDSQTSTAMVYDNLIHGGITKPLNSYKIPETVPLEMGTEYCWRVRPRIQGDGTPVDWSQNFELKVASGALKGENPPQPLLQNIGWGKTTQDYWQSIGNFHNRMR